MHAVIMAGGKGTRIASLNRSIPKAMFKIGDKPVLEYAICELVSQGITDIHLIVGHLGDVIINYFDNGSRWGAHITYLKEETPLGTAGALFFFKDILHEDFLLLNGDIIFSIDFQRFMRFHQTNGGIATLFVHPNDHPYDSGLVNINCDNRVIAWLTKEDERHWHQNRVNAGIHALSPRIFLMFDKLRKVDLDRDVLRKLIPCGKLLAYYSTEYVKDMGTPERYAEVKSDIKRNLIERKNLIRKQRAIFLDRDGTINKRDGYITCPNQICLMPGAAEAIRKINRSGMLAIVVTNQPVIARGDCTLEQLQEIHNALETKLGKQGAYLDAIYYCPHHPERGFIGERPEYKHKCACRKPEPGMILQAANDFNIDLSLSYMIGDEEKDIEAGVKAGCRKCFLINLHKRNSDLLGCVNKIIEETANEKYSMIES